MIRDVLGAARALVGLVLIRLGGWVAGAKLDDDARASSQPEVEQNPGLSQVVLTQEALDMFALPRGGPRARAIEEAKIAREHRRE